MEGFFATVDEESMLSFVESLKAEQKFACESSLTNKDGESY